MSSVEMAEIDAFWSWFTTVAMSLARSDFLDDEILSEIDRRLFSIDSRMNWEVGPDNHSNSQFVISPNYNHELIAGCRAFLELAPEITGWTFLLFKPRKIWDGELIVHDVGGQAICLDTESWIYVMLRYQNGETEILIAANAKLPFEEGSRLRWLAGALALEALLGEKIVMECVHSWEVFEFLESRFSASAQELKLLPEAFSLSGEI